MSLPHECECRVCGAAEEHFSGEECVEHLKSKLEEALHGAEGKRWNMHRSGDGEIQVCFGDHERGTGCQYVTFVEKSRLDSLRQNLAVAYSILNDAMAEQDYHVDVLRTAVRLASNEGVDRNL